MTSTELNTTVIKGNWNILKGQLKQQYAQLTDDDLTYVEGAEDELFGRLQVKLGKTKQEILDSLEKVVDNAAKAVKAVVPEKTVAA